MKRTIASLLLVVTSCAASAQIVKCRDAGGRIHLADYCPPGAAKLREIESPAPLFDVEAKTWQQREIEFQVRQNERSSRAMERSHAAVTSESSACQRAREMVEAIKEKRAFRTPGGIFPAAQHDRIYLDDSERELFENDVRKYCTR